jgi:hypothetical protein
MEILIRRTLICFHESCDEEMVHTIFRWERFKITARSERTSRFREHRSNRVEPEFRMIPQKPFDDVLILLTKNSAGAVDEDAVSLQITGEVCQDRELELAQPFHIPFPLPPLQIRIPADRAESGARHIRQDAIEPGAPRNDNGLAGIPPQRLHHGHAEA